MIDDAYFSTTPTREGVAQGRSVENRMLSSVGGQNTIRTKIIDNPDGTKTRLRTRSGMPEFVTDKVKTVSEPTYTYRYMTSGAYDLGDINAANPLLSSSAIVHKMAYVAANEYGAFYSLTPSIFKIPALANGSESIIYNQTTKPSGLLNENKTTMYRNRPSMFSGLLRRMVQGQYGCGFADCKSGPVPVYISSEDDQRVSFLNNSSKSHGVLRFDIGGENPSYMLAEIRSSSGVFGLKCYPLSIPDGIMASDLIPAGSPIVAGSTEAQAIETLTLANASTDLTQEIDLGETYIPLGESVAYGWSFSMTSNKASIVLRSPIAGYGDNYHWSLLTVEIMLVGGILSYELTVVEEHDGRMLGPISPIWVSNDAFAVAINAPKEAVWTYYPQDFPVYAYYIGDEMKVVRWSSNITDYEFDNDKWVNDLNNSIWGKSIFGPGQTSGEANQYFGTVGSHGFSISGSGTLYQFEQQRFEKNTCVVSGGAGYESPTNFALGPITYSAFIYFMPRYTQINPYVYPSGLVLGESPPDPDPTSHYYWSSYAFASSATIVSETISGGGTGSSHTSILVIPYGDCTSCYIGTRQVKHEPKQVTRYAVDYPFKISVKEWTMTRISEGVYEIGGERGESILQVTPTGVHGNLGDYSSVIQSNNFTDNVETNINLVYHGKESRSVSSVDSLLFTPSNIAFILGHRVIGLCSSIYGDHIYAQNTLSESDAVSSSGYSVDIDEFIGAS